MPMFLPDAVDERAHSAAVQRVMQEVWNATPSLTRSKERLAFGLDAPTRQEELDDTRRRLEELDAILRPVLEQRRKLEKKEIAAFEAMVRARAG